MGHFSSRELELFKIIELLNLQDLAFPAITICNLNKFRAKALLQERLLPNVKQVIFNKLKNHGRSESDWQSTDEQKKFFLEKVRRRSGISDGNEDSTNIGSISPRDILETMTLQASALYPETVLKKSGHQFENLIVSCQWMGIDCKIG